MNQRTLDRLKEYGVWNLVFSTDLWLPLIISVSIAVCYPDFISTSGKETFVELGTRTSQSLIAVTLSGLAILVSFSDRKFLIYLNDEADFDILLFIFEYTVILSVISTVLGILVQSLNLWSFYFYLFLFIFFYNIGSVLGLVSTILRFAESKANFDSVNQMKEEEVEEELTNDLLDAVKEAESNNDSAEDGEADEGTKSSDDPN